MYTTCRHEFPQSLLKISKKHAASNSNFPKIVTSPLIFYLPLLQQIELGFIVILAEKMYTYRLSLS